MFLFTLYVFCCLAFRVLLFLVPVLIGFKVITSRNKNSTFECGFDPSGDSRLPFSLRFFLLAVVFLIFDIEIALLLPVVWGLSLTFVKLTMLTAFTFLLILLLGLLHEWFQGSLS